jgi:uncharacterized protein (TIGR00369 family)
MATIGARLTRVAPGEVEVEAPFELDLTQQHGYLHAGVVTALVDSACGYAALTMLPAAVEVLSVEYKVNFLAPAQGERFVARDGSSARGSESRSARERCSRSPDRRRRKWP